MATARAVYPSGSVFMTQDGGVKLAEWAKREGIHYQTAWKWFKQGMLSPRRTATVAEVGSGWNGSRGKLKRLLADPALGTVMVEQRERLAHFGVEYVEAALRAQAVLASASRRRCASRTSVALGLMTRASGEQRLVTVTRSESRRLPMSRGRARSRSQGQRAVGIPRCAGAAATRDC